MSSVGTKTVMTAVTAQNQLSIELSSDGAQCAYPAGMTTTALKTGTKVRFVNKSANPIRIHIDSNASNMAHQNAELGQNDVYEQTPTALVSMPFAWYCHTPGNNPGNLKFTVQ
jgi:plastocyanin